MDKLDKSLFKVIVAGIVLVLLSFWAADAWTQEDVIRTESITESTVTTNGDTTTRLKSPPASAITPTINTSNSDLCTFGVAGAVQTQILGISTGTQFTDDNCERLKNSKTLYDMGMKVAAVSLMCSDKRVFDAMMNAGTPCPIDGKIGDEAKALWLSKGLAPGQEDLTADANDDYDEKLLKGGGAVGALAALLLLL